MVKFKNLIKDNVGFYSIEYDNYLAFAHALEKSKQLFEHNKESIVLETKLHEEIIKTYKTKDNIIYNFLQFSSIDSFSSFKVRAIPFNIKSLTSSAIETYMSYIDIWLHIDTANKTTSYKFFQYPYKKEDFLYIEDEIALNMDKIIGIEF